MGFFIFKKRTKIDIIDVICRIAEQGVTHLEQCYKPASKEGQFEIYMFNMFFAWTFFLERNRIDKHSEIGNIKLSKLFEYSKRCGINWELRQIIELYKFRYRSYQKDVHGIQNSNYPSTKQHLPIYTFCSMYYQELNLFPDLSWGNLNDDTTFDPDKYEELSLFTGALIKQINWMLYLLNSEY